MRSNIRRRSLLKLLGMAPILGITLPTMSTAAKEPPVDPAPGVSLMSFDSDTVLIQDEHIKIQVNGKNAWLPYTGAA